MLGIGIYIYFFILVSLSFRYWALAVPAYAMVTLVLALVFYIGLNFMSTPPPTSLNKMFGGLTFHFEQITNLVCPFYLFNMTSSTHDVQTSSPEKLLHAHRREMTGLLSPYLIFQLTKSMLSCSMM